MNKYVNRRETSSIIAANIYGREDGDRKKHLFKLKWVKSLCAIRCLVTEVKNHNPDPH